MDVQRVATVLATPALNQVAANADWCRLPNHTGPGIMLTCQLTGCAFIVRLGTDGRLRCAHILPTDPTTGNAIMTGEALTINWTRAGTWPSTDAATTTTEPRACTIVRWRLWASGVRTDGRSTLRKKAG